MTLATTVGNLVATRGRDPSALALAVAGSATVGTAFGMARYGYGLLLPDIQDDLVLGVSALGAIGALAYLSYLLATAVVALGVARVGGRAVVVAGGLAGVGGTLMVAIAEGPALLAAGVATAGASAGLVYAPFGEAVRRLPPLVRARTLTTINCGTGWGVAVAAPIAILAGDAWRLAYVGFAGCAALSTLVAARTLPGRAAPSADRASTRTPPARGGRPSRRPMLAAALLTGLGSATFWTFAVDHVRDAGLDQVEGRILLGVAGVTSLTGVLAADVIGRLGGRATYVLTAGLQAAATATIALAADDLVAVLLAAATFGAAYNTLVAVIVLWSTRLYAGHPAAGVAAATGAQGIGLLCGPLFGGVLAETTSLTTVLLGGALIVGAAVLFAPRGDLIAPPGRPVP